MHISEVIENLNRATYATFCKRIFARLLCPLNHSLRLSTMAANRTPVPSTARSLVSPIPDRDFFSKPRVPSRLGPGPHHTGPRLGNTSEFKPAPQEPRRPPPSLCPQSQLSRDFNPSNRRIEPPDERSSGGAEVDAVSAHQCNATVQIPSPLLWNRSSKLTNSTHVTAASSNEAKERCTGDENKHSSTHRATSPGLKESVSGQRADKREILGSICIPKFNGEADAEALAKKETEHRMKGQNNPMKESGKKPTRRSIGRRLVIESDSDNEESKIPINPFGASPRSILGVRDAKVIPLNAVPLVIPKLQDRKSIATEGIDHEGALASVRCTHIEKRGLSDMEAAQMLLLLSAKAIKFVGATQRAANPGEVAPPVVAWTAEDEAAACILASMAMRKRENK